MIHYVAGFGSPEVIGHKFSLLKSNLEKMAFPQPSVNYLKISSDGAWFIIVLALSEEELSSCINVSSKGYFLVNSQIPRANDPEGLFDQSLTGEISTLQDKLSGVCNFVSMSLKNGLIAGTDFSALMPVYYEDDNDYTVFSNNPNSFKAMSAVEYDYDTLGWLIGHANIFGERSSISGVSRVLPGYCVRRKRAVNIFSEKISFSSDIWESGGLNEAFDIRKCLDIASSNLSASFNASKEKRISLTGGKDSRLILALIVESGVKSDVVAFTRGGEDSPEVMVAKQLATEFGIKHDHVVTKIHNEKKDLKFDSELFWMRLRKSAYRFAGALCPWDGTTGEVNGFSTDVTGFGGELYKGSHAYQFRKPDFLSADSLLPYWLNFHQSFDPLGLLRTYHVDFQTQYLDSWLSTNSLGRRDLLPEKFYVENRLGQWNGPLAQQVPNRLRFTPLIDKGIALEVFKLSHFDRVNETFHFEMMRNVSKKLVEMPFLNDKWSSGLSDKISKSGLDIDSPIRIKGKRSKLVQSWQWDFLENEKGKIIDKVEQASLKTDLDGIILSRKAINFIKRGVYNNVIEAKTILSVLALCILLLGEEELFRDRYR